MTSGQSGGKGTDLFVGQTIDQTGGQIVYIGHSVGQGGGQSRGHSMSQKGHGQKSAAYIVRTGGQIQPKKNKGFAFESKSTALNLKVYHFTNHPSVQINGQFPGEFGGQIAGHSSSASQRVKNNVPYIFESNNHFFYDNNLHMHHSTGIVHHNTDQFGQVRVHTFDDNGIENDGQAGQIGLTKVGHNLLQTDVHITDDFTGGKMSAHPNVNLPSQIDEIIYCSTSCSVVWPF